ncbi:hypothetical protein ACFQMF_01740 [Halorubrum rutilum]|uniref:Uncharacterized protein n=1 Tax=Halorubrum rutilum TaxID=1364933 RepID=A0ABD6AIF2_9EURY|nr:hypothetical protein [Halorubrum rutilum]
MAVAIDRDGADKWRYACPKGHTNWELLEDTIVCRTCPHGRLPRSMSYSVLIDRKTGEEIAVSEVRLV